MPINAYYILLLLPMEKVETYFLNDTIYVSKIGINFNVFDTYKNNMFYFDFASFVW